MKQLIGMGPTRRKGEQRRRHNTYTYDEKKTGRLGQVSLQISLAMPRVSLDGASLTKSTWYISGL